MLGCYITIITGHRSFPWITVLGDERSFLEHSSGLCWWMVKHRECIKEVKYPAVLSSNLRTSSKTSNPSSKILSFQIVFGVRALREITKEKCLISSKREVEHGKGFSKWIYFLVSIPRCSSAVIFFNFLCCSVGSQKFIATSSGCFRCCDRV